MLEITQQAHRQRWIPPQPSQSKKCHDIAANYNLNSKTSSHAMHFESFIIIIIFNISNYSVLKTKSWSKTETDNQTINDGVAHSNIYTLDLAAWYWVWKESVWCFTECAHGETERETVLYNKQFDKLLDDVSYDRTHSTNLQPFGDRVVEEKEMEKGNGRLVKEWV